MFYCPVCNEVKDDSKREFVGETIICKNCMREHRKEQENKKDGESNE